MRIKKDFLLREVPGMNVVMPTGEQVSTFGGAVILNDSALVIYRELEKGGDRASLVSAITREYCIDEETAGRDVDETVGLFREAGILDE